MSLYPKGRPWVAGGSQAGVHHLGHLARHGTRATPLYESYDFVEGG